MAYEGTWDDLHTWLLILIKLEEALEINITDEEAGEIETIQDLVDVVNKKLYGKETT